MTDYFWIFLSVAVIMSLSFLIVAIVTKHKQTMKQLEIEELKIRKADLQNKALVFTIYPLA